MLIQCPECGNDISSEARQCPHCGYPICDGSVDNTQCENVGCMEGLGNCGCMIVYIFIIITCIGILLI